MGMNELSNGKWKAASEIKCEFALPASLIHFTAAEKLKLSGSSLPQHAHSPVTTLICFLLIPISLFVTLSLAPFLFD